MGISSLARIYIGTYNGYKITSKNAKTFYKKTVYVLLRKTYQFFEFLYNGFWLGVLDKKDLEYIDYYYYSKLQKGYHVSSWNLKGLFEWEKIAIESYYKGCRRIMVTGAGAGREVIALEKMGYTVDGFECNPDLVRNGNEILQGMGSSVRLQPMPRNECPDIPGGYDGIVNGWAMYMLIQGKKARINLLKGLHDKLKSNGPLLISFYPRRHGRRYYEYLTKLTNVIRALLKRMPIEVGDDFIDGYNFGHYFTREEITSEMQEAGFQLAHYCTDEYKNLHNDQTSIYGWAIGIKK